MNVMASWIGFAISLVLVIGYEWRIHHLGQRQPEKLARYANAKLRMHWVTALSDRPGFEIVAVQALRNSLMSATISASTAALAVMGAVTLAGATLAANLARWSGENTLHTVLQAMLDSMEDSSVAKSAPAATKPTSRALRPKSRRHSAA